jgi:hypothetical protein
MGSFGFYDLSTVDDLRKEKWIVTKMAGQQDQITIVLNENVAPSLEARARADEIVQAFDTWFAEYTKRSRGLRTAERRRDAACSKEKTLRRKIIATPAATVEGLVAKARCIQAQFIDGEIKPHSDDADDTLSYSIARDLRSMKAADPLAA